MPTSLTPSLGDPAGLAALFAPVAGEKVVGLAVSGGADSLGLMLLARAWAGSLTPAPQLVVYSVDHGLRPEAQGEVAMVMAAAASLGLRARPLSWSGPKPQSGLQEAARRARYRLIAEAMRLDGASVLLTAHHLEDQAETVLMRLAHGSGVEGLQGMRPMSTVEGVRVFRPLLAVWPEVLRPIVTSSGLVPAEDPSNGDTHYERVRWRQAMPMLAELGLDAEALSLFAGHGTGRCRNRADG